MKSNFKGEKENLLLKQLQEQIQSLQIKNFTLNRELKSLKNTSGVLIPGSPKRNLRNLLKSSKNSGSIQNPKKLPPKDLSRSKLSRNILNTDTELNSLKFEDFLSSLLLSSKRPVPASDLL